MLSIRVVEVSSAALRAGTQCDSAHLAIRCRVSANFKSCYQICDNLRLHLSANPQMDSATAPVIFRRSGHNPWPDFLQVVEIYS